MAALQREPEAQMMDAGVDLFQVTAEADVIIRRMRTSGSPAARLHDVKSGGKIQIEDVDTTGGSVAQKKGQGRRKR
jgi:hypothetical protein